MKAPKSHSKKGFIKFLKYVSKAKKIKRWNSWRKKYKKRIDLSGTDLAKLNLSHANLEGVDLSNASLKGTNLTKVNLKKSNLKGANLTKAYLKKTRFKKADLRGAKLKKITLKTKRFKDAIIDLDLMNFFQKYAKKRKKKILKKVILKKSKQFKTQKEVVVQSDDIHTAKEKLKLPLKQSKKLKEVSLDIAHKPIGGNIQEKQNVNLSLNVAHKPIGVDSDKTPTSIEIAKKPIGITKKTDDVSLDIAHKIIGEQEPIDVAQTVKINNKIDDTTNTKTIKMATYSNENPSDTISHTQKTYKLQSLNIEEMTYKRNKFYAIAAILLGSGLSLALAQLMNILFKISPQGIMASEVYSLKFLCCLVIMSLLFAFAYLFYKEGRNKQRDLDKYSKVH